MAATKALPRIGFNPTLKEAFVGIKHRVSAYKTQDVAGSKGAKE